VIEQPNFIGMPRFQDAGCGRLLTCTMQLWPIANSPKNRASSIRPSSIRTGECKEPRQPVACPRVGTVENFGASMKDPSLIGTLIAFLVLALAFGLIKRWRPAVVGQRLLRPGYRTDLIYWLSTPWLTRSVTRIGVVLALLPLFALLGRPLTRESVLAGYGPLAQWSLPIQAVAIVVIGDFVGYWTHRGFHRGWPWRVHAIHHSSVHLDWLAAVRVHPLNDLGNRVTQALVLIGFGFSPLAVAAYQPFLTLYAIFLHANVRVDLGPFRHVIATPAFHHWHHTSATEGREKNFAGLLPLWDLLFGTFHLPADAPTRFGVDGLQVPQGYFAQLWFPFRRPVSPPPTTNRPEGKKAAPTAESKIDCDLPEVPAEG
jgi:sterol desaturase/sphingolipid hydroxylase (fatty acid hydroxylase superfamily)